jgi:hypothetical protein
MRTTYEIIELAQDGGLPEYDELLYALLAVNANATMDRNKLYEHMLAEQPKELFFRKLLAENSYNATRTMLNKSPKEWLGDEFDPRNQDYQKRRKTHRKIAEKFLREGTSNE